MRFERHLENASRIVASWPKWKQNILRDANKAQRDTPRGESMSIPMPMPGPAAGEMTLPHVKITGKFWDDGPFGRQPTWLQLIISSDIGLGSPKSGYLNHYYSLKYQIHDRWYVFYPLPKLPPNNVPWDGHDQWYDSINLVEIEDDCIVVWNGMFSPGFRMDDFREYKCVKVRGTLYGGNGAIDGMEELHPVAQDTRVYTLEHTMFGAPMTPVGDIILP